MRHFTTLEELGDLLIKDWAAVIDLLCPPINPLVFSSTESEVFRQWSAHEAFAMARRQVFVRTPRIREMLEVLSLHAEVEQGIRRKTSMVVPAAVLGTFMTSLPGCDKETLPPVLVIAGMCAEDVLLNPQGGSVIKKKRTGCFSALFKKCCFGHAHKQDLRTSLGFKTSNEQPRPPSFFYRCLSPGR